MELVPKFEIVRKEVDDTHFYFVNGEFFPGVTRILEVAAPKDPGLLNWFKNTSATEIEEKSQIGKDNGSLAHDACEKLLLGVTIPSKDYSKRAKKCINSFYDWFLLFRPINYTPEQTVASLKYKYAGTLDLKCEIRSELLTALDKTPRAKEYTKMLIDFKTNKSAIYYDNKLQVAGAYKQAYEETFDDPIDECWTLRLGTTHKAGYDFKRADNEVTVEDFMNVYRTYLSMNGGKIEEPPIIEVFPENWQLPLNFETSEVKTETI